MTSAVDTFENRPRSITEFNGDSYDFDWTVTVGCFDLLHMGHIKLLSRLRRLAPCVYVCVHDDTTIHRLKHTTPAESADQRIRRLLDSELTDFAPLVTDIDPSTTLLRVFRHAWRRGPRGCFLRASDNTDFPGRSVVESQGVTVRFCPYTSGVSSSLLRAALRADRDATFRAGFQDTFNPLGR